MFASDKINYWIVDEKDHANIVVTDQKEYDTNHVFEIISKDGNEHFAEIRFQQGDIAEVGVNGCYNEDLIEIVVRRLNDFQQGEMKCRENAIAITYLETALFWLQKRTLDRKARGVEGKQVK